MTEMNLYPELHEKMKKLCADGFGRLHIVVVGDLMLDHYIYGSVRRISPEAPVPVLEFERESYSLGGAGNVACNLKNLGVRVSLLAAVGKDQLGDLLLGLPDIKEIDTSCVFASKSRITTEKTRILSGTNQQILRLDHEEKKLLEADEYDLVIRGFSAILEKGVDGVIISDYGKGFCGGVLCKEVISRCRQKGINVFVDPKGKTWGHYAGAFMITPNLKELSDAAGADIPNQDEEVAAASKGLLERFEIDNILVTRSERGTTLVNQRETLHQKCSEKEVFDVSGAGDTMISTLAAFISAGVSLRQGIFAANAAAQIVIQKAGTASVTAQELAAAVEWEIGLLEGKTSGLRRGKLLTCEEAALRSKEWKTQGERVIFTNGCFDILHVGHIDAIRAARALGDRLIVGLNSDESVRRLKGDGRPINSVGARVKMLEALDAVDAVVIFEEDTPKELLSLIRPNVIVKGGDYSPEEVVGREYADEVAIVPLTQGYSTTSIIRKLETGGGGPC